MKTEFSLHRCRSNKAVLKEKDREAAFLEFHKCQCARATYEAICEKFYWYGGLPWVQERVQSCPGYLDSQLNRKRSRPPMKIVPITPKVMFKIHLDLTGRITNEVGEDQVVAIAVDAFTKFLEAKGK